MTSSAKNLASSWPSTFAGALTNGKRLARHGALTHNSRWCLLIGCEAPRQITPRALDAQCSPQIVLRACNGRRPAQRTESKAFAETPRLRCSAFAGSRTGEGNGSSSDSRPAFTATRTWGSLCKTGGLVASG